MFGGGLGLTWWYTEKASRICRAIVSMSISKHQELRDGDTETLSDSIQETLQRNCLNSSLFNGDDVFFGRKDNLFEARSIQNVEEFYKKLWEYILENFKKSIMS